MPLRIRLTPLIRPDFEMASAEDVYANRLVELFETVATAKRAHDDWINQCRPAIHKWVTYNNIAFEEATKMWTPNEQRNVRVLISFNVDN